MKTLRYRQFFEHHYAVRCHTYYLHIEYLKKEASYKISTKKVILSFQAIFAMQL